MLKIKILSIVFFGFISFIFHVADTHANDTDTDYQIYLNGHKVDLRQKAIKVAEFAPIVIRLSNSDNKIHKLKVTLARGNRAVDTKKISGNQVNLGKFKRAARPGDRLVFEIYTENKIDKPKQPLLVIAIPVI